MPVASPVKSVPLAPGHDPTIPTKSHSSSPEDLVTRRAFFAAVVVEETSPVLSQDVQELISALGTRITDQASSPPTAVERTSSEPTLTAGGGVDLHRSVTTRKRAFTEGTNLHASAIGHKRTLTQTDTLQDMIRELVSTEQTYVKRLHILKKDYADPLRNFSKKKEEALLDKYKAKTLFGNIDQLIPVNEAFLHDLEKMIGPSGQKLVGGVGDVCLKHFRDKRAFDCYNLYFAKREEALAIFEEEVNKSGKSRFADYIDRIKYSSADIRNRLGLRELLAEPIQRIPRYTMMWQNIIKEMDECDPQRPKLMEAERIASKIASCESDDQTKRATTMYCLERTIEGFPPGLISNGRRFVDCIDVEDMPVETQPISSGASVSSGGLGALHCTLFLFDDRLIIVKRPNGISSGRTLARLGDVEKLLRTNALNTLKKSGMSCKGVVDVLDITATDAGGPDLHLYLENPPEDQTDRWNGRPFRSYAVVLPPSPLNMDPTATDAVKRRFLENLWTVQALYRVKNGRCVALKSEEKQVGGRAGQTTVATAYYNIYQRNPYLGEPKKPKVVVHVDPSRRADAIPFGVVSGPFVVIRLQPMEGALCRYNVTCTSPDEEEEEDIVHTDVVPARIMQTIHQFGLFSFRTGAISRPNTPTASTRSRAAIFGLDVISRTLMGTTRSGRNNELFSFGASMSGTLSGTGKSRGVMTRTSTQTMSTALTESTNRFSYRSTSTAATSLLEDDSMMSKGSRRLAKGKSTGLVFATELENVSGDISSTTFSSIPAEETESPQDDTRRAASFDNSERDLSLRLELAKRNGLSHRATRSEDVSFLLRDPPFAETIYEEEPPPSKVTPDRRRRRDDAGDADSDHRPDSVTPTRGTPSKPLPGLPQRPSGPRNSLAPPKLADMTTDMPAYDIDIETALDETIAAFSPPHGATHISDDEDEPVPPIFQPFKSAGVTRTPTRDSTASVEPLSIKKKSSVKPRKSPSSFTRIPAREPPSPSQTTKHAKRATRTPPRRRSSGKGKQVERIVVVAKTTREDLSSARRAVKRIKQEVEVLRGDVVKDFQSPTSDRSGAVSPVYGPRGMVRSPPNRQLVNKAAEARFEEMRQMIEKRGTNAPLKRGPSIVGTHSATNSSFDSARLEAWTKNVESLVEDADKQLAQALDQSETLVKDMSSLILDDDSSAKLELERVRAELLGSKRQTDVLKELLQDATAENEVLYATFNQELESMYQDVQLPEDKAWASMVNDLKNAKKARNQLAKENLQYKQKLQIAEQKNEELLAILRAHGLEPGH